jgi:L-seryl-tRNA(Ser) seleniumtransferase
VTVDVFRRLHVPAVINAAGPVTRYGGSCLSDRVLLAMAEATRSYIRLDELQLAVGRQLAAWTQTEAGYVTCGAAAGLTLGAAAIMARFDVERMERLPDTSGMPSDFVLQRSHRSDYDHAIRASGASLIHVECEADASCDEVCGAIRSATTDNTCGTVYVFRTADRGVSLETWVAASKELGLPVLVDAAVRLPPADNLRAIPATGADLVVFSGGKAIGGPQGTGFVVGQTELIESILLQNQDLDVNAQTWLLRDWIRAGKLARPPGNGIGRGLKVSKEEVVGLFVALEEYLARDHHADIGRWRHRIEEVVAGLQGVDGCHVQLSSATEATCPIPMAVLQLTPSAKMSLVEFVNACAARNRPLVFEEGPLHKGYLIIHPMCLSDEDTYALVRAVREVLPGSTHKE